MITISWSSRDAFNANVVDDASGQILFHINTPFTLFGKHVTTITNAQGQVVGEYERRLGYDRVTYNGQTHRVSDWLPRNGFFSSSRSSRRLHAPDGKTYLWKSGPGAKFKLVDARSDAVVARTHAANLGFFSAKHNVIIEAGPEIVAFLDLIVLSFLICEHERQARKRSQMSQMSQMNAQMSATGSECCSRYCSMLIWTRMDSAGSVHDSRRALGPLLPSSDCLRYGTPPL